MAHPHPLPPATQSQIDTLDLAIVKRRKQKWYRIHHSNHTPLFYGCSGHRFDSARNAFGTLYIASELAGAFAETFCRKLGVNRIARRALESKSFSVLETDELNLIDIAGPGAVRAGIDGRLCTEVAYAALTRPWTDAFHRHKAHADGLLYKARHDLNETVAAIFERAKHKIRVAETISFSTRKGKLLIAPILAKYKVAIIPSRP